MKLSELTNINGVNLTKPEMNLLAKLETKHGLLLDPSEDRVHNPMTGTDVAVDPAVAALIRFVQATAYGPNFSYGYNKVAVNDFDRARMLVLKLDNQAYFQILD